MKIVVTDLKIEGVTERVVGERDEVRYETGCRAYVDLYAEGGKVAGNYWLTEEEFEALNALRTRIAARIEGAWRKWASQ